MNMEPTSDSLPLPLPTRLVHTHTHALSKIIRRKAVRDKRRTSESQTKGETVGEKKTDKKDMAIETRNGQVKGEKTKRDRQWAHMREGERKAGRKKERNSRRTEGKEVSPHTTSTQENKDCIIDSLLKGKIAAVE